MTEENEAVKSRRRRRDAKGRFMPTKPKTLTLMAERVDAWKSAKSLLDSLDRQLSPIEVHSLAAWLYEGTETYGVVGGNSSGDDDDDD